MPGDVESGASVTVASNAAIAPAISELSPSQAQATPWSASRQWWLVIVVSLVSTLSAIDRQVLSLFVDPIKTDLGLSDVEVGLLIGAAFAVTGILVGPIAGYLADRFCRRCMFAVSALLWSVMTAFCGLASSFVQLFGARAALGLFEGVAGPVTGSMVRDALPLARRGRAFSVVAMASLVGTGLSMLFGGALAGIIAARGIDRIPIIGPVHPWQLVFIIFGVIGIPAAALMLTIKEPHRSEAALDRSTGAGLREGLRYVSEHWLVYVPIIIYGTLQSMLSLSFAAWMPAMLGRTWHLSAMQIGLTFGIMMLVLSPIGLWVAGVMIDRISRRRKEGAAIVGIVATFLIWVAGTLMPLSPSPQVFWVLLALLLLFSGTSFPVGATLVAMVTPSRAMGKVIALQGFVTGVLSAIVAPSVVPAIAAVFYSDAPRSLNYALSTTVGLYGLLSLGTIFWVLRSVRGWIAVHQKDL